MDTNSIDLLLSDPTSTRWVPTGSTTVEYNKAYDSGVVTFTYVTELPTEQEADELLHAFRVMYMIKDVDTAGFELAPTAENVALLSERQKALLRLLLLDDVGMLAAFQEAIYRSRALVH